MIGFTRSAYDDVISHAYDGGDEEVCGILAGERGETESTVTDAVRAENVAEPPQIRYLIDPVEQFELIESIEESGRDVVGFYHSHPTGDPRPSETDAEHAAWPDHSYVICSLDGYPFVGSWRWRGDDGGFEDETVRIVS